MKYHLKKRPAQFFDQFETEINKTACEFELEFGNYKFPPKLLGMEIAASSSFCERGEVCAVWRYLWMDHHAR
jgi:hypothetical protein